MASFTVLSRLSPSFSVISPSHLLVGLPLLLIPSTFLCIITFSKLFPVLKMCPQYFSLYQSMILSSGMWGCICAKTQSFVFFWQSMESLVAVSKSTFRMNLVSAGPPYLVSNFRCHMSLLGTQGNKPVLFLWLQICPYLSFFCQFSHGKCCYLLSEIAI